MSQHCHLTLVILTIVLTLGLLGCSEDHPEPLPPEVAEREIATSADAAVAQFREHYADRNLAFYSDLLSPVFLFIDQNDGQSDHAGEVAIATAIFRGLEGAHGIFISEIAIDQFFPQGVWTPTPASDENFAHLPGSDYRQYLVDFKFRASGQDLILRVQGPVLFYVMDVGGDEDRDFRIVGIVDDTFGNKATENHSWSVVRSLFQ